MEAAQWAQDPTRSCSKPGQDQERKVRPKNEQALNCPRCHSTNTKFCYYNNYSLTQPRYFCKACKRYWTAGGSLRNIPVGGASRKNKRSSTMPTSSKPTLSHFSNSQYPNHNNNSTHKGQDLNLAFQPPPDQTFHGLSQFLKINSSSHTSTSLSDLLRNGISSSGLNPPNPVPAAGSDTMYNNALGFTFQEFNPTMGFAIDHGNGIKYEGFHGSSQGRIMLPFEALNRDQGDHHQSMGKGNTNGYWNGMLDGGSC